MRRALAIDKADVESKRKAQNPGSARIMSNLAGVLEDQGKFESAESLHRRALKILEITVGWKHRDTATSLNNLASVLEEQGNFSEAEDLLRRALRIDEELNQGRPDVDYASALSNLGNVLEHQECGEQERCRLVTLRLR